MTGKILIVDDDPDVIVFLSTVLQDHGFKSVEASDGREGLEKARTEHPDLILLDLMMPYKSGLSLLSELQQDVSLRKTPVIMVTGVSGETGIDLEAFFGKEGHKDVVIPVGLIEKPVDPERLINLIKDVLSR